MSSYTILYRVAGYSLATVVPKLKVFDSYRIVETIDSIPDIGGAMKTADSIERQEARKEAEGKGVSVSDSREPVSEKRRRSLANLKPFVKGVSGNPGGKPKHDIAAEIAKAIFENDAQAIYAAFAKMLRKGSPYAFQVLSDRAFGKMKETHQFDVSPYRDMSDEDLAARIKQVKQQLGFSTPEESPPSSESKPN